jgi:hypothetical protein
MTQPPNRPIQPSELAFDAERLTRDLAKILERFPMHPEAMQIALTHSAQASTSQAKAYDGIGSLYDFTTQSYKRDPSDFTIFNEDFKDLYFYEVYKKVAEWSPLKIGRVRLMLRKPSSCYSMHFDESGRYHIAITTNPDCYFFFKSIGLYQIPNDGRLFKFDATKTHTGFNAGKTDRIHLVFDTIEQHKS